MNYPYCKASVVIPTKNAGPIFESVLQQVLAQETNWPFEVLVVDSGSSDGTLELIRKHPSVRLIQIPPADFGHGKTRNFAIENSSGEFIAMITQDAVPENHSWLAEMVNAMEQDANIGGVFGRHIAHSNASIFTKNELIQHFSGFQSQPIVMLDDRSRYLRDEGYRQFLYFFSDNNAMIRRSVWEKIPYPEVDFAEDQAWAKLIIEAGYQKAYAHNAVVAHSHNYELFERLQRSFDESYALQRLFNYRKLSLLNAMKVCIAITKRDIKLLLKENSDTRIQIKTLIRMPCENFMRLLGNYLGGRGRSIPQSIRVFLSRDKKLMNL
jgi:rhamnosyltransferase